MTIRLAYDAGPGVGLGHRRRMEALALALARRGREPSLDRIGDDPVAADVVVVDSYRHRADGEWVEARRRVAVDDIGRDLDVDLLVDPSPGATRGDLRGLDYALLDPRLRDLVPVDVAAPVRRVLVTAGGADGEGVGAGIAAGLRAALDDVEVRLVVGPWSAGDVPDGVEPVVADDGLGAELAEAGVVVTAGGVTMLEALLLGRPTVAFGRGEGQQPYLDAASSAGAVVLAVPVSAAGEAAALVADAGRRQELAGRARAFVDGGGADRVAEAVGALA